MGGRDKNNHQAVPGLVRDQIFEEHIKPALIDLPPSSKLISPLSLRKVVKKVPKVTKGIQNELDEAVKQMNADVIEMCRKWQARKKHFFSTAGARAVSESTNVQSKSSSKKKVLVPRTVTTESGIIYSEPRIKQSTKGSLKIIQKFLCFEFNGTVPPVMICKDLFNCRQGLFSLRQFLSAILSSYNTEL